MPPSRDEESETQRKAHAKRVRETRRSTQGVTLDEIKSAEELIKKNNMNNNNNVSTSALAAGVRAPYCGWHLDLPTIYSHDHHPILCVIPSVRPPPTPGKRDAMRVRLSCVGFPSSCVV